MVQLELKVRKLPKSISIYKDIYTKKIKFNTELNTWEVSYENDDTVCLSVMKNNLQDAIDTTLHQLKIYKETLWNYE